MHARVQLQLTSAVGHVRRWIIGPQNDGTLQALPMAPTTKDEIPKWWFHTTIFVFMCSAYCRARASECSIRVCCARLCLAGG